MFTTHVYIVQKRPSPPIPRPCRVNKVDTSPAIRLRSVNKVDTSQAIRLRFINITPKKSATPRL